MGGRISTYKLFRQIHLYAAFAIMVFLVMYFVSGFLLVRYNWFDHETAEEVVMEVPQIDLPDGLTPEQLAKYMKDHLKIPGKLQKPSKKEDGTISAQFTHPQAIYRLTIAEDLNDYTLTKQNLNVHQVITVLHRLHQYGGGFVYDLYMVMMDLSSISLILFAITGIYLWLKVLKKKMWGIVFLTLGFVYTAIVLISFYFY